VKACGSNPPVGAGSTKTPGNAPVDWIGSLASVGDATSMPQHAYCLRQKPGVTPVLTDNPLNVFWN